MSGVKQALRQARIHAARHMKASEQADLSWSEHAITEIVIAHAAREVHVVSFTQPAESVSGADWVWWWVDGKSAYGMIVQAKRATVRGGKWTFDFGYLAGSAKQEQRNLLISTARQLELMPVYSLYLGTGDYRMWERCSNDHRPGRCLSCVKRTVSLMPALLADESYVKSAKTTYDRSVAMEELWTLSPAGAMLIPELEDELPADLSDFLRKRQNGTRAVTRAMIDRMLKVRLGQLEVALASVSSVYSGQHDELGRVFKDVPDDTGH